MRVEGERGGRVIGVRVRGGRTMLRVGELKPRSFDTLKSILMSNKNLVSVRQVYSGNKSKKKTEQVPYSRL